MVEINQLPIENRQKKSNVPIFMLFCNKTAVFVTESGGFWRFFPAFDRGFAGLLREFFHFEWLASLVASGSRLFGQSHCCFVQVHRLPAMESVICWA